MESKHPYRLHIVEQDLQPIWNAINLMYFDVDAEMSRVISVIDRFAIEWIETFVSKILWLVRKVDKHILNIGCRKEQGFEIHHERVR